MADENISLSEGTRWHQEVTSWRRGAFGYSWESVCTAFSGTPRRIKDAFTPLRPRLSDSEVYVRSRKPCIDSSIVDPAAGRETTDSRAYTHSSGIVVSRTSSHIQNGAAPGVIARFSTQGPTGSGAVAFAEDQVGR